MTMPSPITPRISATPSALERRAAMVVIVATVLRLVVASMMPLSPDEAYYWLWTRPPQLSYFDHPGMVAWWIWTGVRLLGDTALGVRLPAIVAAAITSAIVWDTARRVFRSPEAGALAAIWLNASVLFASAGVLMTPDAPLLVFWSLALWAIARLVEEERPVLLYAAGVALGLGVLSKYTVALILPGVLASFLLFAPLRRWWRSPHLWLAALLALACTAPLIVWNAGNGWASFHKQFGHAFAATVADPLANLLTFVGSQVGLVTPLLFVFVVWAMGWALWNGWRQRRADWFLLGATSLPVLLFFVFHTLDNVVQAHWAGPAYLGGVIAAAGIWRSAKPGRALRILLVATPVLGLALTLLVYLQAATAILPLPAHLDPFRRLGGSQELASALEEARIDHPKAFLFVRKHELAGRLAFFLPDHPTIFISEGFVRPSFYTAAEVAALKGRDGLLVTQVTEGANKDLAPFFARLTVLEVVTLHWGRHAEEHYAVTLAEGYKGGLFVMGDGMPGAMDPR